MKSLCLTAIALVVLSCAQQKSTVQSLEKEQVHRYSTVYEGNKIIRYDKRQKEENISAAPQLITATDTATPDQEDFEKLAVLTSQAKKGNPKRAISKQLSQVVFNSIKQSKAGTSSGYLQANQKISENEGDGKTDSKKKIWPFFVIGGALFVSAFFVGAWVLALGFLLGIAGLFLLIKGIDKAVKNRKPKVASNQDGVSKTDAEKKIWPYFVFGIVLLLAALFITAYVPIIALVMVIIGLLFLIKGIVLGVKRTKEKREKGESVELGNGFKGFILTLIGFLVAFVAGLIGFYTTFTLSGSAPPTPASVYFLMALAAILLIVGLVFAISGIIQKKSRRDKAFGIVVLSIPIIILFAVAMGYLILP